MPRAVALIALTVLLILAFAAPAAPQGDQDINVVYVVYYTDDQGWHRISSHHDADHAIAALNDALAVDTDLKALLDAGDIDRVGIRARVVP